MRPHISKRGNAAEEYLATVRGQGNVSRRVRHLFYECLGAMERSDDELRVYCRQIRARPGLFGFDCLIGDDPRARRPWAALARIDGVFVLLHALPEFTGGVAELAAAEDEAEIRYDLELER